MYLTLIPINLYTFFQSVLLLPYDFDFLKKIDENSYAGKFLNIKTISYFIQIFASAFTCEVGLHLLFILTS